MKNKNLKTILIVEVIVLVCVCLGFSVGAIYLLGNQAMMGGSQPSAQPIAESTATALPVTVENPTGTPTLGPGNTALEKLPDGSVKYTDYDAGFEMVIPPGWLAARPGNADEFNSLKNTEGAKNLMLADQMEADLAGYEAGFDRLFAYPARPDIQKDVIFGFAKLGWDADDAAQIDNRSMGEFVRNLESSGAIPGYRATASNIVENGNQVAMIVIKGRFSLDDGQGGSTPFVATFLFFKPTPKSTARMTFTVLKDYDGQIAPDIEALIQSIKLLGQ